NGLTNAPALTYSANAPPPITYTFTGPTSGTAGSPSSNFTVTPSAAYTGTVTITPTGSASSGLSPIVLTFTNSAVAQTFTVTPNTAGTLILTPTNNNGLTNAPALTYTVTNKPIALIQQTVASWTSGTSFQATFSVVPQSGSLLICAGGASTSQQESVTGISSTGATWHLAVASKVNFDDEIWYAEVGSNAGNVITITLNAVPAGWSVNCSEWSGILSGGELDVVASKHGNNNSLVTGSIAPPAGNRELIFGEARGSGTLSGPTNGFTALNTPNGGWQFDYKIVGNTSGSYSTGWSSSASIKWESEIAAFRGF
ncbi:MAG TPA: hypothetical protein VKE71_15205, partial [Candidatus Angelobacter sp.]|nr:hypothetical protein [Candidatus Angelobacter sp.]